MLYQTDDGGDVTVTGGVMAMDGGLGTTVYLSLFGGNEDDPGGSDAGSSWWANLSETDPVDWYRSETQHLLQALAATSENLRRVEDAVNRDLAWLVTEGVASTVSATAAIPQLNKIHIAVSVVARGLATDFAFIENWKASV